MKTGSDPPSIIWCDQRTGEEVEEMLKSCPRERWIEIMGQSASGRLDGGEDLMGEITAGEL